MKNEAFWTWFEAEARPRLVGRADTFAIMFEYLDGFDRPVTIIETGCARKDPADDFAWRGDGCSTIMFDRYVAERTDGSVTHSVDIDRGAINACAPHISRKTGLHVGDSIEFLTMMADLHCDLDLLYLDSFDFDPGDPIPSATHHYRELVAAMPMIQPDTLVVVDDSPAGFDDDNHAEVGGKGFLVARHMALAGADLAFCSYQTGWTNAGPIRKREDEDLDALVERARRHVENDHPVAAEQLYRLILGITTPPDKPHARVAHGEACAFYGKIAVAKQRFGVAGDWFREALKADPLATDVRLDLVTMALMPMGNLQNARTEAERATKIAPDYWKTWHVFGGVLHMLNESKEAAEAYDKEITVAQGDSDPDAVAAAIIDRISIAIEVADYDKARELLPAVMESTHKGDALHSAAMIAHREHRHEEAIELFDAAIAAGTNDPPQAHWNKSLSLHAIGRYREGWIEHAWREKAAKTPALSLPMRRFTVPLWRGEGPAKEDGSPVTIHVHSEAGNGDNLCMVRYLRLMVDRGYKVHYEATYGMDSLIAQSFPDVTVMPKAPDYPGALGLKWPFDYHLPIGELPHVFETDIDTVPWFGPYIKADPILADRYRARLSGYRGRKIGICWSAGIREGLFLKEYGMSKSVKFTDLGPILKMPLTFVALQVGPEREELDGWGAIGVLDLLPEKPTWQETAALVANLDLVITVDTAVAHLAGGMGKPVWVISRRDGMSWHFMCWRPGAMWNERSPWYPSARVFRKKEFDRPHYWDDVVKEISSELEKLSLLGKKSGHMIDAEALSHWGKVK
jgi:tetratricopeptide (TPR) repeat protein